VPEQKLSAWDFFMSETKIPQGFRALNLSPSILLKLERFGFVTPTPIQEQAIPPALEGRDLVGIAQTGTGKTLAFGLPILARLPEGQVALILAPTRELALQIEETFRKLNMRTALLIGGAPIGRQISQLRGRPSVIVATPGRMEDLMNQNQIDMRRISIAVLDEADRMLDMGFAPTIRRILDCTQDTRQTMLFSATMPKEIADMAQRYLRDPLRIEIKPAGTAADNVEQEVLIVPHEEKGAMLRDLLAEHKGTILVFARTRHGARKVAKSVRIMGHSAAEIHSDRTLAQRMAALRGFKNGEFRVLVATDIAARGIDVKDIEVVINYDVPDNPEDYIHRIGRTGRAGASGRAITMATPDQHSDIRGIEKLLRMELLLSPRSHGPVQRVRTVAQPRPQSQSGRPAFQGNRGGNSRFKRPARAR
jgi:ATP-dependent RNA helicase RhlE